MRLAGELVRDRVAVLVSAGGTASALAAKAATGEIPIVFGVGVDPVELGLVASLNRPGGNATGVTSLNFEVAPKRLELLRELLPSVTSMGLLVNPAVPANAGAVARLSQAAAQGLGLQLHIVRASSDGDFDAIFEQLVQQRVGALVIGPDTFFTARSEQLAKLTVRHALALVISPATARSSSIPRTEISSGWAFIFWIPPLAVSCVTDLTFAVPHWAQHSSYGSDQGSVPKFP
jgi:putative tryptophan/tyrosine transport system substrate-binding protein